MLDDCKISFYQHKKDTSYILTEMSPIMVYVLFTSGNLICVKIPTVYCHGSVCLINSTGNMRDINMPSTQHEDGHASWYFDYTQCNAVHTGTNF